MQPVIVIRRTLGKLRSRSGRVWSWLRSRPRWQQAAMAVLILLLIGGAGALARKGTPQGASAQVRSVTLESVGSLSGTGGGGSIVGSVRSVTQADLYAEAGGTVKRVNARLGAQVPAGYVIADLDNASQAAAVLQAEGAYDAAIAARDAQSLPDTRNSAREAYQAAYTSLDTVIENDIDQFFGMPTPTGPRLLINQGRSQDLGRKRQALDARMNTWQGTLASAGTAEPSALLNQAIVDAQAVSSFLLELAAAANETDSDASAAQISALADARAAVDATLSRLMAAKTGLRTGTVGATASADASVKSALGTLRAAQAAYEKTRIRATIGGTINYLPIQVGSYVTALQRVATVANNGALEIVAYVPEEARNALSVGMKVSVEGDHPGTVTTVAPALDPTNKQIEVRIAVDATPDLVNGQSVRVTLPTETTSARANAGTPSSVYLLPLTAVKLLPESRAVFTVDTQGRVVAHAVTIGDVVGERIEVLSGVSADMRIITDVRGLSAGQKVQIAQE